jgi:hypothetical protein
MARGELKHSHATLMPRLLQFEAEFCLMSYLACRADSMSFVKQFATQLLCF